MKHAKILTLNLAIFLALLLFATPARAQDSDSDGMPNNHEKSKP